MKSTRLGSLTGSDQEGHAGDRWLALKERADSFEPIASIFENLPEMS